MNDIVLERIKNIRKAMDSKKILAMMISIGENRHYLSGYTGEDSMFDESAGVLFITAKDLLLATDARFDVQAKAESPMYEIHCYKKGLAEALPDILNKLGADTLGFESVRLSCKQYNDIQKKLKDAGMSIELAPVEDLVEDFRTIKSEEEIRKTQAALNLAENAFTEILSFIKPGMTEKQAAWKMERLMREAGAQALSFQTIVASGPNSALPHAIPGDRKFKINEPILFDWGARLDGYCSDTTRTIIFGKPDRKFLNVFNTVLKAQEKATRAIKAGQSSKAVDYIARHYIDSTEYKDKFGHGLGHGTGLAIHEAPRLSPLKDTPLESGMIVTVEPGIYLAGWGGVRLENQVVVRNDHAQILNSTDPSDYLVEI